MSSGNVPEKLQDLFRSIIQEEWTFLDDPWPMYPKTRRAHRSEFKVIKGMRHMKLAVMSKLGAVAVYFFLTVLWNKVYFPGPYKALEKGIAFLYFFVSGESMESMSVFMPRSSFYEIFRTFFKEERSLFNKEMARCFSTMFSTPEIRMRSARWSNPKMFKHVTLLLDGHDTRATYGELKSEMYSFKFRKSGLRTQVCIDVNNMVVFVSKSESCKKHNDGTMLVDMGVAKRIHEVDCIGLDGGYPQHIPKLLEKEDTLDIRNFCFPIRKRTGQPLDEDEATFNTMFAGFRSMVENTFGELGSTFAKFNHKDAIRTTDKREVNMMLRLCFLLLNVRNMSNNLSLDILPHHMEWTEDGFDYPTTNKPVLQNSEVETVQNRLQNGSELQELQNAFLGMDMSEDDEEL